MKKINIGKRPFMYPMPMTLIGTLINNKPNFMPAAWITTVEHNPPMLAVSIGKNHITPQGIKEHQTFSVCIPGKTLIEKTDYCGMVSAKNTDKSTVFTVYYEDDKTIPLIEECPVCIQLKVNQIVDLPGHDLFIGDVITTFVNEECLSNNKPDIQKIAPFTLTMPDNNYWEIGKSCGKAWNIGNKVK